MGKVALLAALTALLVTAPAATASLKPPTITESFTVLPCPAKPKTTLDLEGCAEKRILKSNAAIDARAKAIFFLFETDAARGHFVRGERAWLTYRRAVCETRSDAYEGGTLSVVVFANCEADLNATHLKELAAFERNLRER